MDDALRANHLDTGHPVPIELVHRVREEDAFPVRWAEAGEDRFLVHARWPHDHPFYAPLRGLHDPLMLVETMRQSAVLVIHAGYGVPVGHHFLLAELEFTCRPEGLEVGDGPTDVEVEVRCEQLRRRGGHPSQIRSRWVIRAGGTVLATGEGLGRMTSPQAYRRLRGAGIVPVVPGPAPRPIDPARAGRGRAHDVVLSATSRPDTWRLRVDTGHATLFQRANDHIPGMLLLEAARQAAAALTAPAPFFPHGGSIVFDRYAEFADACWIEARTTPPPPDSPDAVAVRVTGSQDGHQVFGATLLASAPAREAATCSS
ncbi:ScbA/BarX family gamma-butyrolactone biosynthesis protein [Streptomyces sp. AM 4-1-1]|uniref:ScbA/BarX family gamma-butyrolactone biosynthesis protein n=1 Tax=Streptomyces sp. AM 4-1-1 TaxID=3028710 RepID=UPI0023B8DD1C|nr:ScbA/BarX family gamma-butyrolactone biosynthesis protein [Streptomyces sp. AM 4-1-1]WEH36886.1 ScbA/BarX family gamma-butyrolactone biosynthesis protein [Streptomyces sp. AM 4-1-1]